MKKTTSFAVGFLTVLIAGVAVAQVGTGAFKSDAAGGDATPIEELIEKPVADTPGEEPKAGESTDTTHAKAEEHVEVVEEPKPEEDPKPEADETAPEIVIIEPVDGTVFNEKTITFRGETEPGTKVFGGKYEADVDSEGRWAIKLVLSPGENHATFKAIDAAGNIGKASVLVIYKPIEKEPVDRKFSANQKFGKNTEPYDKFWGAGIAGSVVTARSEFGFAKTEVNHEGEWYLKVWFEGAPVGVTFPVKISDEFGHTKVFEFRLVEAEAKEFWAKQKYGSCSETPPYDVFYGEGKPGTVVEVGSKYGSGRTVIGDGGGWDMKVVFEGAPAGEPFEVVLETSAGHRKVFTFVYLAD